LSETQHSLPSMAKLEEVMEAGNKALRYGLWRDALGCFQTAIELKPQYVDAWLGKAAAQRGAGDHARAVESYRKMLEVDAGNKNAWIGLIETLHEAGMYKQEIEACDCLLRLSPRSDDALLNKGVALHAIGKLDDALQCFSEVVDRRPESVAALNNKGAILLRLGRLDDALEAFDAALTLQPQHEEVQRNRCLLLVRLGRYSEAIRAADEMLAVKEEGWLWMLKGLAHAELREVPLAVRSLERAKGLDPNLEGLGDALDRMHRLEEAMEKAEKKRIGAVKPGETGVEVPVCAGTTRVTPQAIAVVMNHIGFPTEALRIWQESMDKESPDDWLGLGRALMAGGEKKSAVRCLDEACRRSGRETKAPGVLMDELPFMWRETSTCEREGRTDEAVEILSQVLEHKKDLEHGWEWLGVLRALDGHLIGSEAALLQAAELQPSCATAWSNLGAVLTCLCKLDEASSALRKALEIDPDHIEALHNLGVVESRRGNNDEARRLLRKALAIVESQQTWLALAQVTENLNRWREATRCYEKALTISPKNASAMAGLARARGQMGARKRSLIEKNCRRLVGMPGVGPSRAKALAKAGYSSAKSIAEARVDDLVKLPGFSRSAAVDLKTAARQLRRKRKPRSSPGK